MLKVAAMDTEKEYKEKVKHEDDGGYKVETEIKDEFGNKIKEKHEKKVDQDRDPFPFYPFSLYLNRPATKL